MTTAVYRPELQGLRTVAAGLVAVYHIWFDRVSGGVDVFFVVSGFLILGSIHRSLDEGRSIDFVAHSTRIARRIVPAAYVVLLVSLAGTLLIFSSVYWEQTFSEIRASALYVSNIEFARNAVDYLAQGEIQSPVLHFWALSVQGQFYVLAPLAGIGVAAVSVRFRVKAQRVFVLLLVATFAGSLWWSVVSTGRDQVSAYYSTTARLWEFALGGLVWAVVGHVRLGDRVARALGWIGLSAIVLTGVVVDVGGAFPGVAALAPTLGAAAVILAGSASTRLGAVRLLSRRGFVALGDLSYAFFLWHWPLFIFVLHVRGSTSLSVIEGACVLAAALVLAAMTVRWVEQPFMARRAGGARRPGGGELLGAMTALVLLVGAAFVHSARLDSREPPIAVLGTSYPGATALDPAYEVGDLAPMPVVPDPASARRDRPDPYSIDCHQNERDEEVLTCSYGDPAGPRVVLFGGSHSTQWQPALEFVAERRGWNVINMTKSSCRPGYSDGLDASCARWIEAALDEIVAMGPDLVVTTSTIARREERVGEGFVETWQRLDSAAISVVAIRDNPWFSFFVPECVEEHPRPWRECEVPRSDLLAERDPAGEIDNLPDSVELLDFTEYLCPDDVCRPVIGNVLVYRDRHHLSVPFSRSLGPILDADLDDLQLNFEQR